MIAESPQPLTGEMMTARIYAPFAYPLPRRAAIVPIAVAEGERLCASFPLAWRAGEEGPELVALRSLLDDGTGFAPGTARALALLPLLLQAYPFLPPAKAPSAGNETRIAIDAALPDEPSDAGAAIAGPDGRPSRGTELKLRALDLFGRDRDRTLAVGRALEARDLLEPWPLRFDLGHGRTAEVEGLRIVAQKSFATPALAPVLAEFGVAAARLLGQHRLSLFRAGALLAAAQAATAAAAKGGRP